MDHKVFLVDDELELLEEYDRDYWLSSSKRRLLRGHVSGRRVLILGCGPGYLIRELVSDGFDVVALDISAKALGYVREKVSVGLVLGDAVSLPFRDGFFDCVIAADVLEHVGSEVECLREINRVLVDAGFLVFTVPAKMCLWSVHDVRLKHSCRYEREDLRLIVRESGFGVVKLQYWNMVSYPFVLLNKFLRDGAGQTPDKASNPILNSVLPLILYVESLIGFLPVGVKLFGVCRKK